MSTFSESMGTSLLQAGQFHDLAVTLTRSGDLSSVFGGVIDFLHQFDNISLGLIMPEEWKNVTMDLLDHIQDELLKPEPWNDISAL